MALSPPPDQQQFDALLAAFSTDRDQAAQRYLAMRQKLIRFFAWEGLYDPELWADEVLNRTALKLAQDVSIENIDSYAHGIARFVLKEAQRIQLRETQLDIHLEIPQAPHGSQDDAQALLCLNRCLGAVPSRTKDLILRFYQGDAQTRIRNRQQLALQLGLNLNALRNRALRVRQNLEKCVFACLERDTPAPRRTPSDGVKW
jgi:DNA-directed RNA polymerase specialized sigma24 family protein